MSLLHSFSLSRALSLIEPMPRRLILRGLKKQYYAATHCNTLLHTASHCNSLQHPTISHLHALSRSLCLLQPIPCRPISRGLKKHDHTAPHCTTLHHTAPHCTTLHHPVISAAHCSTLQHTATHCNALQHPTISHLHALSRSLCLLEPIP